MPDDTQNVDSKEDAQLHTLLTDALAAERARDSDASHLIRLLESLLILSPQFAENNSIDEKLWSRAVYPAIERKRADVRAVNSLETIKELLDALNTAEALYTNLILELRLKENLDYKELVEIGVKRLLEGETGVPGVNETILSTICKQLIHLGDIARYRALALNGLGNITRSGSSATQHAGQPDLSVAAQLYSRALLLHPISGRAQCQLAVVAAQDGSVHGVLETAYWSALSISSAQPHALAKSNLKTIFNKASSRLQTLAIGEVAEDTDAALARFLLFLRLLFFSDSVAPTESLRAEYDGLVESIPTLLMHVAKGILRRLIVCLVLGWSDLSSRLRTSQPEDRDQLTSLQSLCACVILDILTSASERAASRLRTSGWSAFDSSPALDAASLLEPHIALAPFLSKHLTDLLRTVENVGWYGDGIFAAEFARERGNASARALAELSNAALDALVLEKEGCLVEDAETLGAVPFRGFFGNLAAEEICATLQAIEPGAAPESGMEQVVSRALLIARCFVLRGLLTYDEELGYATPTGRVKRSPRKPTGTRTEDQDLEPVLVLAGDAVDTSMDLTGANVVVPHAIETRVKGARKQRSDEAVPIEDGLALASLPAHSVSSLHRAVLSCAMYFLTGPEDGWLVTDDPALTRIADALGIARLGAKDAELWARRRKRELEIRERTAGLGELGRSPRKGGK